MAQGMVPDVLVVDHGSLFRMIPRSPAALAWAEKCIGAESRSGRVGFLVEPRYLHPVVQGMLASGLLLVPAAQGDPYAGWKGAVCSGISSGRGHVWVGGCVLHQRRA